MRPDTAQEQHDRMKLEQEDAPLTDKQVAAFKALVGASEQGSSKNTSTYPPGLVGAVMKEHGVTQSRAEELLEAFGA